jgi:DMSO/TMAO reductase YedYZ molybdopterin-dependent catalytic subunit
LSSENARRGERALLTDLLTTGTRLDRRQFFVSAAAAALTGAGAGSAIAQGTGQVAAIDPSQILPLNIADRAPKPRFRSSFVKDVSRLTDLNSYNQGASYWNFTTYMTPIEDFFIRNEYATPRAETDSRVDPANWSLKIHGDAVKRPLTIYYEDLLRMPSRSITTTLECAGNGRNLFWEQQGMTEEPTKVGGNGWLMGGIGQAEFQIVPMSHILGLVGIKKNAKQALFWSGVDGKQPGMESDTGRPIPASMLIERSGDIGLAFRMNGRELPPDHGGPVRALVPGWCGAASTKWLTEIKIASHNFWVRLNSNAHVMIGPDYMPPKPEAGDEFRNVAPDGILGPAVTWSPPRSLLTVPLVLEKTPKLPHNYPLKAGEYPKLSAGKQMLRGYAWAPREGVGRVEVRIDGGAWVRAGIMDLPTNNYCWVRWVLPYTATPGRHVIETRTTDRKGLTQPETVPFNRGGFDNNAIPKFKVEVI